MTAEVQVCHTWAGSAVKNCRTVTGEHSHFRLRPLVPDDEGSTVERYLTGCMGKGERHSQAYAQTAAGE
ncbi:hypothetical protein JOC69_000259 [Heliobacterium gestii]|nr:hypothetical protein [Heliomicrobium gestii]